MPRAALLSLRARVDAVLGVAGPDGPYPAGRRREALVLDLMVLGAMIARIGDLGFTPNRTAALGLNLVLLVNLAGAAWLSARFLTGRSRLHRLERWQTTYRPVFALWAAAVVVMLPPLFAFD